MDISHQHSTSFNCLSLQLSDIQSVANIFGSKCKGFVDGKLPKKAHPIHTTRSPELVGLPWPATFFERKRVYWNNKNWKQQILSCKIGIWKRITYTSRLLLGIHPSSSGIPPQKNHHRSPQPLTLGGSGRPNLSNSQVGSPPWVPPKKQPVAALRIQTTLVGWESPQIQLRQVVDLI